MAHVIFYEKTGCKGNARQRGILRASGHEVEARSILDTAWTAETLGAFFAGLPVEKWFNASSAPIKNGQIDPARLEASQALELMVADPILIRRPLMQVGEERVVGFDVGRVAEWIGLTESAIPAEYADGCMTPSSGSHCSR